MASNPGSPQATCDKHVDRQATAICWKHHELLCTRCILLKERSGRCNIIVFEDIQNEREQCILEHVCVKQTLNGQRETKSKLLSQTQELKEKLLNEIGDLHKEFSSRLDKMAETCEKSVKDDACKIAKEIKRDYKYVDEIKKQMSSNLEKLNDKDANINECFAQLSTIQKDILAASNENMSEVEGSFKPDESLSKCLKNESFGHAELVRQLRYAVVGYPVGPDHVSTEHDVEGEICTGSDEVIYPEISMAQMNLNEVTDQTTDLSKTQKEKNRKGLLKKIFKRKSMRDHTEKTATKPSKTWPVSEPVNKVLPENAEVPIPRSKSFNLQDMGNKTKKIPDFDSAIVKPGLKFTKLIHLGDGCIGLLADSTVLVTQLPDGPTLRKQFSKPVSSIVSTGCREITVLSGEQINVLGIQGGKLTSIGSYIVQETITGLTGFDFDVKTSRYAISTLSKVLIIDKNGSVIKQCAIKNSADASNIRSVYDFNSDNVVYLNIHLRTLKALMCNKDNAEVVWKKQYSEEKFVPKNICLYNDVVCVASTSSIAIRLKTNGEPVHVYETSDILSDCLAVCATDGIAMWTSGAVDKNLSTTIGFVAL